MVKTIHKVNRSTEASVLNSRNLLDKKKLSKGLNAGNIGKAIPVDLYLLKSCILNLKPQSHSVIEAPVSLDFSISLLDGHDKKYFFVRYFHK